MPYTVQDVYTEVCDMLLEPGGLSLVYTQAAFLRDLETVIVEMCQDTKLAVALLCIDVPVGVPDVELPESCIDVYDVVYRHRTILPNTSFDIAQDDPLIDSGYGQPQEWYRSNLDSGTMRLVPAPRAIGVKTTPDPYEGLYGTIGAMTGTELTLSVDYPLYGVIGGVVDGDTFIEVDGQMLGTIAEFTTSRTNGILVSAVRPISDGLTLDDIIAHIPDTFAIYLKWYVLRNIWSTDGESKDIARAKYAMARIEEIRNLIDAVNREDLQTAP